MRTLSLAAPSRRTTPTEPASIIVKQEFMLAIRKTITTIDKTRKKKSPPKNIVQSEIHTIHRNYDGQLLRSSLISGNKQIGLKSTHLPKVEGKNSNFKKSKIGVAGDFDSKNVNIHQSVNVGISGKKAGSKIISQ